MNRAVGYAKPFGVAFFAGEIILLTSSKKKQEH